MASAKAAPAASPPPRKYTTARVHPTYTVEPCPNCDFPEADGGFCPDCGWTLYRASCPHCVKGDRR